MSALFSPTALVVSFENLRMTDVEAVGGKNASLGEMISQLPQGVLVPTGFATTATGVLSPQPATAIPSTTAKAERTHTEPRRQRHLSRLWGIVYMVLMGFMASAPARRPGRHRAPERLDDEEDE